MNLTVPDDASADRPNSSSRQGNSDRSNRKSKRNGFSKPKKLSVRVVGRDSDGELLGTPTYWRKNRFGPLPTVLVIPNDRDNLYPVGIGSIVEVKVVNVPLGPEATLAGKVTKVRDPDEHRFLAVVEKKVKGLFLVPVDRNSSPVELRQVDLNGAEVGDLVTAELIDRRWHSLRGAVCEKLCAMNSEYAVSQIAVHKFKIPHKFSEDALTEANAVKPEALDGREDWRSTSFITIDPASAKDHDDAVHAELDTDTENSGGVVIQVAIADVAHYVRPDSAMDREAELRGNSVYFPDRVIPMLPERISNDLCSLREGEDRPALAVRMVFDRNGRKIHHSFHRVVMRSHAKLSYQQAQSAIDGSTDATTAPLLKSVLQPLWKAYAILQRNRENRSPLDLELPERKLELKPDGTVDRVIVLERLDAHKLIEEFMIQANVAAAETLEKKRKALLYRIHDAPSLEKLESLREFLQSIDIKLAKGQTLRPAVFNNILHKVANTPHETMVNEVVLRSQSQAEYNPSNIGHFGLNLHRYAHFTSPIRRYADLTVHRGLISAMGFGNDGQPEGFEAQVENLGSQISNHERRAMAAERETVDRLTAYWIAEQSETKFSGRISGVIKSGLFVQLDNTGIDGFVPVSKIGFDYYLYQEATHSMIGEASGEGFQLGDNVEVKVAEVVPYSGSIRLDILSDGRKIQQVSTRKKRNGGKADGHRRRRGRRRK